MAGDFSDLPQAFAAASPGDTIYVYGGVIGPTTPFSDVTTNKGVKVLLTSPGTSFEAFTLHVHDLPAGQQFTIRGGTNFHSAKLRFTNCAGRIAVDDWLFGGSSAVQCRIEDCAFVSATRCDFNGTEVTNSTLLMTDCELRGWKASQPAFPQAPATGVPGILAIDSDVTLSGCIVVGVGIDPPPGTPPMGGIEMTNGSLRLVDSQILPSAIINPPTNGPSIRSNGGVVEYDARSTVDWGLAGDSTFTALPYNIPFTDTISGTANGPLWIELDHGMGEVPVVIGAGLFGDRIPTPFGEDLWMDPNVFFPVVTGVSGADGILDGFTSLNQMLPPGFLFGLQGVALIGGEVRLSTPVSHVVNSY